jgi:hypothetical protein
MEELRVAICGGGRTGHLNAVLFGQRPGVHVSLLTHHPAVLDGRQPITAYLPDGSVMQARPDLVTNDPHGALRDADLVVVTVPAHARPALLSEIANSLPLDKPVFVGAIPGFCGFDWLAEKLLADRPNAVIWGMKDVPHTAFDLEPGTSVRMGGAKATLHVAAHARESDESRERLRALVQRLYDAPVELLRHYLEITLTPGNPIMHGAAIYGLIGPYGPWHGRALPGPVCWWTECSELSAYFLERSDEESQRLCRTVGQRMGIDLSSVKPLKQEIVEAYGEQIGEARTMLSVLRTNRAYDAIQAPMVRHADGWRLDTDSRAFQEDVAFGLATLVQMARRLDLTLPHLEETFAWCASHMGGLRRSACDYFPAAWPA